MVPSRARPLPSLLALALALAMTAGTVACDEEDEIGTPCEAKTDCSESLICDIHDGQGTCQYDHGHRVEGPRSELAVPEEP